MKPTVFSLWREPFPLVLASASAIRLALLQSAGLPTQAIPSGVDEAAIVGASRETTDPAEIAFQLARAKTLAVSRLYTDRIVVGADQTLSVGGRLMSKATDRHAAAIQLAQLSGREHRLHSAIAIARHGRILAEAIDHASMQMRELSDRFIADYLMAAGDAVLNSVGCYQLEGLGVHLFKRINGDHTTILGMPLLPVLQGLRQFGSIAE